MRTISLLALYGNTASAALSDIKNYAENRCAAYLSTQQSRGCEQCAGDCDTDVDCKGDLVCYQFHGEVSSGTNTATTIPSCYELSYGWSIVRNRDYCVDPVIAKQIMSSVRAFANAPLRDYGASPMWVTGNGKGAHSSYGLKLGNCAGDCDYDSDCVAGATCYKRDSSSSVPGCNGTPVDDHDYCIFKDGIFPTPPPTRRPTNPPTTRSPTNPPTKRPTAHPTTARPTRSPTTAQPTGSPTGYPTAHPTSSPTSSPAKNCRTEIKQCPFGHRNNFQPCPTGGCTVDSCCDLMPSINPPVLPKPPTDPVPSKCDHTKCMEWSCNSAAPYSSWCDCFDADYDYAQHGCVDEDDDHCECEELQEPSDCSSWHCAMPKWETKSMSNMCPKSGCTNELCCSPTGVLIYGPATSGQGMKDALAVERIESMLGGQTTNRVVDDDTLTLRVENDLLKQQVHMLREDPVQQSEPLQYSRMRKFT